MLKSSLCDYSDAYILCKKTITVPNKAATNNPNKNVIFENCTLFTDRISEINNTQVDNAKYVDVVIMMYNLIENSYNYSKTSGSLCHRDESASSAAGTVIDFPDVNNSASFKFKQKITVQARNEGTKDLEIIIPL